MKKTILIITVVAILFLVACGVKEPIKIGLLLTLTGENSEIGVAVRDGFLLKVEEINELGGINGRKIEVIIENDKNNFENIPKLTDELIEKGVDVIFGYELSSKVSVMQEAIKDKDIVVFSATMSTDTMSNSDDNFFRTASVSQDQGILLGKYISKKNNKTLIIYDERNLAYAEGIINGLKVNYSGEIKTYSIKEDIENYQVSIIDNIEENNFDSILLILRPYDTTIMVQEFYKEKLNKQIYSSSWGIASNIYEEAGKAIHGLVFTSSVGGEKKELIEFKKTFEGRYNKSYHFVSGFAYDGAAFIFKAMENAENNEYETLKKELLKTKIDGLFGSIELDENGDSIKTEYIGVCEVDGIIYLENKQ